MRTFNITNCFHCGVPQDETVSTPRCKHFYRCITCTYNSITSFYNEHGCCMYCILEGNADELEIFQSATVWGGNFYEFCRPANAVIEFGMKDRNSGNTIPMEEPSVTKWSGTHGDPKSNISCFYKLYLIGFERASIKSEKMEMKKQNNILKMTLLHQNSNFDMNIVKAISEFL